MDDFDGGRYWYTAVRWTFKENRDGNAASSFLLYPPLSLLLSASTFMAANSILFAGFKKAFSHLLTSLIFTLDIDINTSAFLLFFLPISLTWILPASFSPLACAGRGWQRMSTLFILIYSREMYRNMKKKFSNEKNSATVATVSKPNRLETVGKKNKNTSRN